MALLHFCLAMPLISLQLSTLGVSAQAISAMTAPYSHTPASPTWSPFSSQLPTATTTRHLHHPEQKRPQVANANAAGDCDVWDDKRSRQICRCTASHKVEMPMTFLTPVATPFISRVEFRGNGTVVSTSESTFWSAFDVSTGTKYLSGTHWGYSDPARTLFYQPPSSWGVPPIPVPTDRAFDEPTCNNENTCYSECEDRVHERRKTKHRRAKMAGAAAAGALVGTALLCCPLCCCMALRARRARRSRKNTTPPPEPMTETRNGHVQIRDPPAVAPRGDTVPIATGAAPAVTALPPAGTTTAPGAESAPTPVAPRPETTAVAPGVDTHPAAPELDKETVVAPAKANTDGHGTATGIESPALDKGSVRGRAPVAVPTVEAEPRANAPVTAVDGAGYDRGSFRGRRI